MEFIRELEMRLYVPAQWTVPADMGKRWKEGAKNAAEYAFQRLIKKIGFDGDFIDKMATPSNRAYKPMINPTFISKSGRTADEIIQAQAENMAGKFPQWLKNLQKAYAKDGAVYKDKIDSSEEDWIREASKTVYRLTGSKKQRSVAPVAVHYLVGEKSAVGWLTEGWKVDGEPYNIVGERERSSLKAALQQRLVQGGCAVINSKYQETIMNVENALNAMVLNRLRDPSKCAEFSPTLTTDKCFCGWEMDNSLFLLHILIGRNG
ncbi:MAG: hypothetical protein V1709_00700 [Planctomycetota bacterium]